MIKIDRPIGSSIWDSHLNQAWMKISTLPAAHCLASQYIALGPWPLAQSQDLVVSLAPDGSDNDILSNSK